MSTLEKIQKGMQALRLLTKVLLIVALVGAALSAVGSALVASDVLRGDNQFLSFLVVAAEMSKGQILGILIATALSLLVSGIISGLFYHHFTEEIAEGTPFTHAGADRIKRLGMLEIALSVVSTWVADSIYEGIGLEQWNRFGDADGIAVGVCLLFLSLIIRYGAELER